MYVCIVVIVLVYSCLSYNANYSVLLINVKCVCSSSNRKNGAKLRDFFTLFFIKIILLFLSLEMEKKNALHAMPPMALNCEKHEY